VVPGGGSTLVVHPAPAKTHEDRQEADPFIFSGVFR
jgi:hypothetical protein